MIAAGLLLVVLGYVALWYFEASRVRAQIDRFLAARADHGMVIQSEKLEIGGFPFRLEADFGQLTVDGLPYAKPAHLSARTLTARARPWNPGVWRLEAPLGFTVGADANGAMIMIVAGDARGRAEAEFGDPGSVVISIDCHDLSLQAAKTQVTAGHASLQLTFPGKPPEDHTSPSLTFAAVVDRAVLPSGIESQDGVLDRFSVNGVVEGPVPEQPLAPALTAWRAAGGSVELRQVTLHWGAVDVAGDGTLTLDANLQPEAAFSVRVRGWSALLDDFVEAGTITADQAKYDRLGLSLLTRTAADGKSELRAPITLQNQQLYLGPAKIARVALISWR
ncbi:MAG: hypothetical protein QOJ54_1915 [Aliidongia sp.]|nr:hypothetical protein [Aliidongia sp.]